MIGWKWENNRNDYWLTPSNDVYYLSSCWRNKGFRNILDLGCGLGRHSIYFAKEGFNTTSLEVSSNACEYLRKWAKRENVDITITNDSMNKIHYKDRSFDCVFAYNVIYHSTLSELKSIVHDVWRILKSDGEFYLTMLSNSNEEFMNVNKYVKVDNNVYCKVNDELEEGIPHVFLGIEEINDIFSNFEVLSAPIEVRGYNIKESEFFSTHWILHLRKI